MVVLVGGLETGWSGRGMNGLTVMAGSPSRV